MADERRNEGVPRAVIVLLAAGAVAGAAVGMRQIYLEAGAASGGKAPPVMAPVPEFTFTRESGDSFGLSDLRGHVWVADFIFTRCAGPCPRMTLAMAGLQERLPGYAGYRFVSFSVDPEHDTPDVLSAYARDYEADTGRWAFLTGERDGIYDLCIEGFKLPVDTGADYEHMILHSSRFVLVDAARRIRGYYDGEDEASLDRLVEDARYLANETGRP